MNLDTNNRKNIVMASVIIGIFIASALLTIFIPTDEEGKEKTEMNESRERQTDEKKRENGTVAVADPLEGDPYEELNSLIGLESVKAEVLSLANTVKVQKEREKQGLKNAKLTYHCVFTGNPGTGKTTVARIIARIYKDLGVVKRGQFVETDRSGLIAKYEGQTAMKTNAVVDSALNGVLFIDEAYALVERDNGGYGAEAIATLLKRMEDDRDRLVVIVAGYDKEMERFIDTNPGLKSRFTRYIHFPDYSADDLYRIFVMRAEKFNYRLDSEAEAFLKEKLEKTVAEKNRNFGNARYARNLFEQTVSNHANRVAKIKTPSKSQLSVLKTEDVQSAYQHVKP
ncbi:MAG: AAA family ATPase [Prevotellaceae bacterium]|nr:AAA family ATPase [Prevotella sp.]MDD7258562.1 AAA family ATPase [Prevotellaceae bacterium]MDY6131492.1 AAA family ATPase [Prevotella sp.]